MLSFEEARAKLFARVAEVVGLGGLGEDEVRVGDAAGRVLSRDVSSKVDVPGFDASTMDGYAVRVCDLSSPPGSTSSSVSSVTMARLRVVGESRAGSEPSQLASGTAMRIFTGAPLPLGADAVVMQENVRRDGEDALFGSIDVNGEPVAPARLGAFVRKRADDLAAGTLVLSKGTRLGPAHLPLIATAEHSRVWCHRMPRVIVAPTGDELRAAGSPPRPGSIVESNSATIVAMCKMHGIEAKVVGPMRDDANALREGLEFALSSCDALITIGGVSVGDHDLVRPTLEALGVDLDFIKVAVRPGKPLSVGSRKRLPPDDQAGTLVLGLPGNPASALVTFALFGLPALRLMFGDADVPEPVSAVLADDLSHERGRRSFVRATLDRGIVRAHAQQASGSTLSLAHANALISLPPEVAAWKKGDVVDVYRYTDLGLS